MFNYHEMTVGQQVHYSDSHRQQFRIISAIMAAIFVHSVWNAGGMSSLVIQEGIFPGGIFLHQFHQRDYAATHGLLEIMSTELNVTQKEQGDFFYSLYLDNPMEHGGSYQRFVTGILLVDPSRKYLEQILIPKKLGPTQKKKGTSSSSTEKDINKNNQDIPSVIWSKSDLPSVDSAILEFPCTFGFVSALMMSYRVIPALRRYAQEKGESNNIPIVLTTCHRNKYMCTHYAPLVQGSKFLLGLPDSLTYSKTVSVHSSINWEGVRKDFVRILPPLRYILL